MHLCKHFFRNSYYFLLYISCLQTIYFVFPGSANNFSQYFSPPSPSKKIMVRPLILSCPSLTLKCMVWFWFWPLFLPGLSTWARLEFWSVIINLECSSRLFILSFYQFARWKFSIQDLNISKCLVQSYFSYLTSGSHFFVFAPRGGVLQGFQRIYLVYYFSNHLLSTEDFDWH